MNINKYTKIFFMSLLLVLSLGTVSAQYGDVDGFIYGVIESNNSVNVYDYRTMNFIENIDLSGFTNSLESSHFNVFSDGFVFRDESTVYITDFNLNTLYNESVGSKNNINSGVRNNIVIDEDYIYIYARFSGIEVLNRETFETEFTITDIESTNIQDLYINENYLFAVSNGRLEVFNKTDSFNKIFNQDGYGGGNIWGSGSFNNTFYFLRGRTISKVDTSTFSAVSDQTVIGTSGFASLGLFVQDNYLFVARDQAGTGFYVFDLTSGFDEIIRESSYTSNRLFGVSFQNDFILTRNTGLYNLSSETQISTFTEDAFFKLATPFEADSNINVISPINVNDQQINFSYSFNGNSGTIYIRLFANNVLINEINSTSSAQSDNISLNTNLEIGNYTIELKIFRDNETNFLWNDQSFIQITDLPLISEAVEINRTLATITVESNVLSNGNLPILDTGFYFRNSFQEDWQVVNNTLGDQFFFSDDILLIKSFIVNDDGQTNASFSLFEKEDDKSLFSEINLLTWIYFILVIFAVWICSQNSIKSFPLVVVLIVGFTLNILLLLDIPNIFKDIEFIIYVTLLIFIYAISKTMQE